MQFHYSTEDLPVAEREPSWREVWSKLVFSVIHDDRPAPSSFRARIDGMVAGRFAALDVETGHHTARRTRRDVIRDNTDTLFLLRPRCEFRSSIGPTFQHFHSVHFVPGDLGVASAEWLFDSVATSKLAFDMLLIPEPVVSPLLVGGRLTRPAMISSTSPIGSLLGTMFDAAKKSLPLLSPELGDAVLHNLCGLVALACGASEEGQWSGRHAMRAAHLERAKWYVERHLPRSDLAPTTVAAALGISVSHLHRLFEPTGTSFARYVQRRRLLKCQETLRNGGSGRSIADIAFAWGFNSLATFYRAFIREFGTSPTAIRSAGPEAAPIMAWHPSGRHIAPTDRVSSRGARQGAKPQGPRSEQQGCQ